MDNSSVPNGLNNNSMTRQQIISGINQWNSNKSLGYIVSVNEGIINNIPESYGNTDGRNEIFFSIWGTSSSAYAITRRWSSTECDFFTPGYSGSCVKRIVESDVFFNYNHSFSFSNNNCPHALGVMRHEVGHALGLIHDGGFVALMGSDGGTCINPNVREKDFENLKKLYPSLDTIDIIIGNPRIGQTLIVNQAYEFSANIVPFGASRNSFSAEELKAMGDQLIWKSSIDGVIARGNNEWVSNLSPGEHELTVTIGQPGDQVYGDGTSSFFVLDEVITDYTDRFHPYPCPRIIGSNNNSCLMSTSFTYNLPNSACERWLQPRHKVLGAFDTFGSSNSDYWNEFSLNSDTIPSCRPEPFPSATWHELNYKIYSWINSNDNVVDFRMNYQLYDPTYSFSGIIRAETITGQVPLVDAEVDVLPIESCEVESSDGKCSVVINWRDLFFAPDAGIYYRKVGSSSWTLLRRISSREGSYTTGPVVDSHGVEFMVFQFSRDVYTEDPPFRGRLLIDAPRGRMIEPILVKAIDTSVPDNTPTLDSVAVIGETTYKVELLGEKFGVNTSVSVRENVNGSQPLAVYSSEMFHNNGTHVSSHAHAGKDFIRFPVIKTSRQSIFRNSGLCFKVLSDSLESNEVCYTMPPRNPQPDFAGGLVQSYNHRNSTQDIDIDAFVTKSNGNSLKLWGNSWKKVPMSYSVTPNTELNINFKSTLGEVEIAGVGFILQGQTQLASSKFWQFHGTQNWGIPDHNNYSGTGDKSYTIKVGEQFTGQISHMVFVADHDNQDVAQNVVFQTPTLVENIPGVDAYDDVPAQRAFDDDVKGRAVNWTGGTAGHEHTFHDAGDVDWTIVHTNEFRARTELIGSGADTKLSVYRWISADPNQSLGYYENVVDEFVGKSDTVGASEYSVYGSENYIYAIKVESRNNVLGENSKYRLILDPTPPFRPDEYDDVPARRGFNDDVKGQAVLWTGETSGFHQHNFHDAGDVDWTIIYAEDFKVRAEALGANASTKMTLYKWVSATPNSNLGYYVNVNDQLISQDHSGGDTALLHFSNQANIYAVKIESKNGAFGPGTEYQLAFSAIQNTSPDGNENKAGVSGYTDDFEGTPASWNSGDTLHMHNFHDNGDIDWTLVYANNFTAHADAIGQDADLKMTIYQWTDYDVVGGIYRNIVKQQVGYDGNGGDGLVSIQRNEPAVYAIKIEPKNGAYGSTTNYSLRLY